MALLTRRGFIKGASIGGVTLVLASVPGLAPTLESADAQTFGRTGPSRGPIVAYLGDTSKDEITLLIGTRKVVVRDRKLVAQLERAAR